MNELALFAGIGGGVLGGRLLGWRTVCYVENDAYCIEVLKARIREGCLCDAPIWDDIKTFDGKPWAGLDVITAGFPCQPFSVAGKQKAERDDRNLWPETIRIIRVVRPRYAFLENVPGLLSRSHGYFGRILGDLAESGYDARWRIVSAGDAGAPHLRKRLWILAYSPGRGETATEQHGQRDGLVESCEDVGNADGQCLQGYRGGSKAGQGQGEQPSGKTSAASWFSEDPAKGPVESRVGRLADGTPDRMERQRVIGNAQVPAVARLAWNLLISDG